MSYYKIKHTCYIASLPPDNKLPVLIEPSVLNQLYITLTVAHQLQVSTLEPVILKEQQTEDQVTPTVTELVHDQPMKDIIILREEHRAEETIDRMDRRIQLMQEEDEALLNSIESPASQRQERSRSRQSSPMKKSVY